MTIRYTPKTMVESIRITYDFDHARTVVWGMLRAVFDDPELQDSDEFAKVIGESLKFDTKTRSHMDWATGEIREFLELFERLDPSRLLGYAVMNDLIEQIADRVISITTKDERTGFPVWFAHYLRKSEAEK